VLPDASGLPHGSVHQHAVRRTAVGTTGALDVIDQELQDGRDRDGQGECGSVAQPKPRGPVAERAGITAHRIRRFTSFSSARTEASAWACSTTGSSASTVVWRLVIDVTRHEFRVTL
jgi:hypothetical protein